MQVAVSLFLAGNENGKDNDKGITKYTKEGGNEGWTQVAAVNHRREYEHHNQHMKKGGNKGTRRDRTQRDIGFGFTN